MASIFPTKAMEKFSFQKKNSRQEVTKSEMHAHILSSLQNFNDGLSIFSVMGPQEFLGETSGTVIERIFSLTSSTVLVSCRRGCLCYEPLLNQ